MSLYSLNQKVDDGSVTLQSSSSVPLFSAAFFLRTFACNVVMKVIINVDFEAVFVSQREVRKLKVDPNMVHCVKSMKVFKYPVIPEHYLLEVCQWVLRPRRKTHARFSCYWEQNACSERYKFFDFLSLPLINGSIKTFPKKCRFLSVPRARPPALNSTGPVLKKL